MYWSWKQFLLLVYFEVKCSLFGFFKMLRMKIRITGLQLQTARTEINSKQKRENIFYFFWKDQFLKQNKTGGIMLRKIQFSCNFLSPIKGSRNYSVRSFKSIDIPFQIIKSLIKIWILIYIWVFRVYIFRICIGSGTPNPWIDLQFCQKI